MNEEDCSQIVDTFTRIRSVGGIVQRSCLDHATVNCKNKITTPVVIGVGKSDHLGVIVTKASREIRTSARTTRKRIYKNFDKEAFLKDVTKAKSEGKFAGVLVAEDPDDAFRKNAMKLTRIRAVEQVKKMVALVDDIAETTIKNSVLGEEMRTKSPLGMQMIMTKLSGRNTVGKDTNGKFVFCF